METIHPICCGLDVHQASVTACLRRVTKENIVSIEHREFSTTVRGLMQLAEWLEANGCPIAAMESTGVYWKPAYHILSATMEIWVANARDVKQRRGKKTDPADAKWIAELLAHGLIDPSFIPPPEISALRDMIRMRTTLVQLRTQLKNRILAVLEDTNVKLASVVSDPFGVSGRRIIDELSKGNRDPKALSQLAKGVLRRKIPQLEVALEGNFTDHHALLIGINLDLVDHANAKIAKVDERIEEQIKPMQDEVDRIESIPGVGHTASRIIISEIGTDMTRFGSAARLAAWAAICPGNNESAGKRRSGKTRKGNRYLKRVLVECAWATKNTDTFLGRTFRRLQSRIGGKKAAVAVGHKILVIVYHLLLEGTIYDEEKYNRPNQKQESRRVKYALSVLREHGYQVKFPLAA
jgi:transposase